MSGGFKTHFKDVCFLSRRLCINTKIIWENKHLEDIINTLLLIKLGQLLFSRNIKGSPYPHSGGLFQYSSEKSLIYYIAGYTTWLLFFFLRTQLLHLLKRLNKFNGHLFVGDAAEAREKNIYMYLENPAIFLSGRV